MFKKGLLTTVLLVILSCSAFACWFNQENFNNAYIAGVNFYKSHYDGKTVNIENATFKNGFSVSLPLTVWFKVSPRTDNPTGDYVEKYDIVKTILYYRVISKSKTFPWRIAKTINMEENAKWKMNFNSPVMLFGKSSITKGLIKEQCNYDIQEGDAIIIAWYIMDSNACSNARLINDGDTTVSINPENNVSSKVEFDKSYKAAYVMKVIYNGKTTVGN